MLGAEEEPIAERTLAARYGLVRELFERAMDLMRVDMCYLEITPGAWHGAAQGGAWKRFVEDRPQVDAGFAADVEQARKTVGPPESKWPMAPDEGAR